MRRKKTTDRYAQEKRRVFSFDLREQSENECLTERGREFHITGPMRWIFPPTSRLLDILGTRKMRVSEAERREREKSRDEITQSDREELYPRQCGSRLELFCIESGC